MKRAPSCVMLRNVLCICLAVPLYSTNNHSDNDADMWGWAGEVWWQACSVTNLTGPNDSFLAIVFSLNSNNGAATDITISSLRFPFISEMFIVSVAVYRHRIIRSMIRRDIFLRIFKYSLS